MQGRSYMSCGMLGDAEKAFRASLGRDSTYVHSVSGLGEVAYAKGNLTEARSQWEKALSVDGRLPGAHINIATLDLAQLKKLQSGTPAWKTLEKSIRDHLSLALAVDNGNIQAYTVYALVYMEGVEGNKNRLDLAKLLLDEGLKASKAYAPLHNAFGLYYMKKNLISGALTSFMAAVELDGKFAEARLNAGLIQVSSRRYADAKTQLGEVVKLQPKNYDAWIGLGIAQRGLNELGDAESSYKKAKEIDGSRGEAAFNLGVLYKDFYGAKEATDLKKGKEYFSKAREFFADAQSKLKDAKDREEAKQNVTDCEKLVASYEEQIKIQAAAPAGS
ncbi:MAG: tetratricopeptide repeat protein [Myxococcales bacterium]|nr:tetratricopeptide repeat protein [Myxococcales bacterium]